MQTNNEKATEGEGHAFKAFSFESFNIQPSLSPSHPHQQQLLCIRTNNLNTTKLHELFDVVYFYTDFIDCFQLNHVLQEAMATIEHCECGVLCPQSSGHGQH